MTILIDIYPDHVYMSQKGIEVELTKVKFNIHTEVGDMNWIESSRITSIFQKHIKRDANERKIKACTA